MVRRLHNAALTQVNDALSDSSAETLDFSMRQEVDKILKIGARIAVCMSKCVHPRVFTFISMCRDAGWLTCTNKAFPLMFVSRKFTCALSVRRAAGCTGTSGC